VRRLVLLVGEGRDWQPEMGALLAREGYRTNRVAQLEGVLPFLEAGTVQALIFGARPLGASDLLVLGRIREASPGTAIVVVARTATDTDLKRAFESGATTFLSWPASTDALRHAIDREARLPSSGSPARPTTP
jgi:two-component system response regulator PilR (NtrC family)